ncbi:hypothetical protein POM88_053191 [Heracleum sosnowskyi]|uniref:Uncharacterized protein n=1 Tax=Heracleum sosnowskyi TaxID=360622 RepID=A0AAD8GPQ9_9APIA|nr:hypothetical protein POM88_053191 [Heracleum sosnowskyi]
MLYNSSLGSSSRKARSRLYKGYTRFSKLLHTSRKIARHRHEPLPLLEHQMARPCQTRRKRVAPARGLPADILEAIAEEGDISDPEAFERQHDEQLVGDSEEGTETEVIESEEEDPEEDPTMEDTEVIEESEDEDPEELQLVSEVRVMETDTDLTTEQVMGTALAETVDEGAEGDTEGQPEDDTASEGWETETFAGELAVTTAERYGSTRGQIGRGPTG